MRKQLIVTILQRYNQLRMHRIFIGKNNSHLRSLVIQLCLFVDHSVYVNKKTSRCRNGNLGRASALAVGPGKFFSYKKLNEWSAFNLNLFELVLNLVDDVDVDVKVVGVDADGKKLKGATTN